MSWQAQPQYPYDGDISEYRSTSTVELSYLPSAAASSKKHDDIKYATDSVDELIKNAQSSNGGLQRYLDDLQGSRWGRYMRINPYITDGETSSSPYRGWRKAVILAAVVTGVVLMINLVFAVVTAVKYPARQGVGTLYTGDCTLIKRWDTALHLTINLLGTALLAASSFTMQCLCSPTRSEVVAAHAKRKSLDIGLQSWKNLFHMRYWKGILWGLLCFSTLPLHLLWNSTIFTTNGTNLYSWVVADASFLEGAEYAKPNTTYPYSGCNSYTDTTVHIKAIYEGYKAGDYVKLTTAQCFDDYNVDYINDRRNLIMITTPNTTMTMTECAYQSIPWNGSSVVGVDLNWKPGWHDAYSSKILPEVKAAIDATGSWIFDQYPVEYCYSQVTQISSCELQYVSYIIYIVVVCNIIKFFCMGTAARYLWDLDEPILATIGDAVSSFIDHPDGSTKDCCLLDAKALRNDVWRATPFAADRKKYHPIYARKPKARLYDATSGTRWWWTIILCTLYLIIGFVLFGLSFQLSSYNFQAALKLRFGQVDSGMILGLDGESGMGLIIDVLVANSFQIALSTTYFLYNSLYTAQYAALEWADFASKHKSLRVTWPRGQQRSTYYLQLPYRYGIPLTALLIAMHFLISQSIFLARLRYYAGTGDISSQSFTDVGFSPVANLVTCCVGAAMILAQVAHARRPLDNRIPIHGNQSACISAMCHPEDRGPLKMRRSSQAQHDIDSAATKPVIWGVTREPDGSLPDRSDSSKQIIDSSAGHCCFTIYEVRLPEIGKEYR